MLEGEKPEKDRRIKIRPRAIPKETESSGEEGQGEESRWENVQKKLLRQSGTKFPARNAKAAASEPSERPTEPKEQDSAPKDASKESQEIPDVELDVADSGAPQRESRHRSRSGGHISLRHVLFRIFRYRAPVLLLGTFALVLVVLSTRYAYRFGVEEGKRLTREAYTKERTTVPPEFLAAVDAALVKLRDGDAEKALPELLKLEAERPDVASLSYLVGLAALQAGDLPTSDKKLSETIAKRERVSDALALQAVLTDFRSKDPGFQLMTSPLISQEALLRQAILADSANPFPYIELSSIARARGKRDEAIALLRSGQLRLTPIDSHTVVDASLAILELENVPDDQLAKAAIDLPAGPGKLFARAYAALRLGDNALAAELLKQGREQTHWRIFLYLMNDPAIRKYSDRPEIAEFFL